jgi:hypothetical protein
MRLAGRLAESLALVQDDLKEVLAEVKALKRGKLRRLHAAVN